MSKNTIIERFMSTIKEEKDYIKYAPEFNKEEKDYSSFLYTELTAVLELRLKIK